ncbi:MAG: cobalamin-dependent protein, partial [Syntrophobacteraceae bacterium]|nr:cobalamin-dependent protein [Syntrophobacteraceae bacterium]
MRVLIVNPPWPGKGFGTRSQNRIIKHRSDKFLQYPIYLAYSAAQLKEAGHEVSYIDSVIQDYDLPRTISEAVKIGPEVIFMETTTPSISADYENLARLKEATNAKIVVGGPHATYFHRSVLEECQAIDVVIRHEFDTKISAVVSNMGDLDGIPGITYRKGPDIVDNG